jgi:hypothetical protein
MPHLTGIGNKKTHLAGMGKESGRWDYPKQLAKLERQKSIPWENATGHPCSLASPLPSVPEGAALRTARRIQAQTIN